MTIIWWLHWKFTMTVASFESAGNSSRKQPCECLLWPSIRGKIVKSHGSYVLKSFQMTSELLCYKATLMVFPVMSPVQMSVTWESPYNLIVTLFGDLSQGKGDGDFEMESPNDFTWESQWDFVLMSPSDSSQRNREGLLGELSKWWSLDSTNDRKKDMTFWFTIVTVTLVT